MKTLQDNIHSHLLSLIELKDVPQKKVFEAARYILNAPGKYLRPLLTLITADIFGASFEEAIHPAASIELIHTYSCIHDDLPCMDDDALRRGKPTLHVVYDEATAVLTGDLLFTLAFESLSKAQNLSDEKKVKLIQTISTRANATGMIGGQIIDLEATGKKLSESELLYMHELKTANLMITAVESGGIVGNATEKEKKLLASFGKNLGISFQIVDDLLDITSSTEELGKEVGSDEKLEKPTSVNILGVEKAKNYAKLYHMRALDALNQIDRNTKPLKDLSASLLSRKY